jgi:peptidoglycan/LPS O-acetylase OafA/YrhL
MNEVIPEPTLASRDVACEQNATAEGGILARMPQLDGLRALAVAGILWSHAMPVAYISIFKSHIGHLGVQLFFVLSGFLISGILLDISNRASSSQETWFGLSRFYIRRFLRIFPLYYMVLFLAVLFKFQPLHDSWPWHAAYLSNFYSWNVGNISGYGAHFWSLSVEEQFYLLWPILILFAPKKLRLSCILVFIALAPLFRLIMELGHWGKNPDFAIWLMPANLDSLGVGALLAYANRNPFIAPFRLAKGLLIIGLAGFTLSYVTGWCGVLRDTLCAFSFGWLVWRASQGFDGAFGRLLQWRPIAYLGKISYGVYVIHAFATALWIWMLYAAPVPGYRVFTRLHVPSEVYLAPLITLLMTVLLTIPLASMSFRFYETPLNDLKRRFPYFKSDSSTKDVHEQRVDSH